MDDLPQIVNNPTLQWKSAPHFFVEDVWRFPQAQYRNYYRPIFLLWLLVNFKLFGLHPSLWHLAAIALHGVVVVMVFRLGLRLMGNELAAAAAALLFAVHPTHVESVVWLSGITEPLVAVFFLGAFLQYLNWRETNRVRPMLLCALLTLLALLAKETAAALPLLIMLYEWLFPRVETEKLGVRVTATAHAVWPVFGATAVYACMRLFAMNHVVLAQNSPVKVLMTWPLLLWKYVGMTLWPTGLALLYDLRMVNGPSATRFWLPVAFLIGCAAIFGFALFRNKLVAFLACWWLLPLVPALVGLLTFPDGDIIHDRYTYLPSVAFVLLLGLGLSRLPRSGLEAFRLPLEPFVLLVVLVGGWGVLTALQTQVWSSGLTLFGHSVAVAPNNLRARNLLANQFFKAGDTRGALMLYDSTLRLDPNAWETNFSIGVTLASVGQLQQGESFLRRACVLDRKNPESYLVLADVLCAESHRDDARGVLREGLSAVDMHSELLQRKLTEIETAGK